MFSVGVLFHDIMVLKCGKRRHKATLTKRLFNVHSIICSSNRQVNVPHINSRITILIVLIFLAHVRSKCINIFSHFCYRSVNGQYVLPLSNYWNAFINFNLVLVICFFFIEKYHTNFTNTLAFVFMVLSFNNISVIFFFASFTPIPKDRE